MAKKVKNKGFCLANGQFSTSRDVGKNFDAMIELLELAREAKADVVHFPEGALSGFARVDFQEWESFDWVQLADAELQIRRWAKDAGIWVIYGTARKADASLPYNSVRVVDVTGRGRAVYDKRFCSTADLGYFTSGDHETVFTINGVRCGVLICYEVLFPELYADYYQSGVQVMFHSFHNVGRNSRSVNNAMPGILQGMAMVNQMWISGSNAAGREQTWASLVAEPDGYIVKRARRGKRELIITKIDPEGFSQENASFEHWSRSFGGHRKAAIKGERRSIL